MDSSFDPSILIELQEQRERVAALERGVALRQNYGINFYRPHWKQHLFHKVAQWPGRYCRFGNRTGKTVCGAAEDVAWCLGERPWYREQFDIIAMEKGKRIVKEIHEGYAGHPLVTHGIPDHPVKGLLVASDWDKAKEIFTNQEGSYENWGDLFQMIPKEAIADVHKSRGGHVDMVAIKRTTASGGGVSLLYIDTVESYKHAWRSAESSDFDFVHYDEPPPRGMFQANMRGLTDRHGKFWINATPVEEQWINEEFSPDKRPIRNVPDEGKGFQKTAAGGKRYIITATIFDNPYISPEGISEFEATLNREERECRLHGLPLNLAGLVYKEFIFDLHVLADVPVGWSAYHLPPLDHTIRGAWDVHDAIPQAVLLAATAPTEELFIYDEIFDNRLIAPTAKALKERLHGRYVEKMLVDPRAVIESNVTGLSLLDELASEELFFELGSKDMELGISKTRERLLVRGQSGYPTIWFSPECSETVSEIMSWCYNPKTQKPYDKDDHMLENLRRIILEGTHYVKPPDVADYTPKRKVTIGFNEDARGFRQPSLKV